MLLVEISQMRRQRCKTSFVVEKHGKGPCDAHVVRGWQKILDVARCIHGLGAKARGGPPSCSQQADEK